MSTISEFDEVYIYWPVPPVIIKYNSWPYIISLLLILLP